MQDLRIVVKKILIPTARKEVLVAMIRNLRIVVKKISIPIVRKEVLVAMMQDLRIVVKKISIPIARKEVLVEMIRNLRIVVKMQEEKVKILRSKKQDVVVKKFVKILKMAFVLINTLQIREFARAEKQMNLSLQV